MPLLATALGLSLLGSCGGLLVAVSLLLFTERVRTRLVPWLVSYAVGALLGVALLALLPEALETLRPSTVFGTLLAGILTFFVLEKLVLLRHCHTDECQVHARHRAARAHRRRVPQLHRRRHHLHGRADVGAARHQHGHRRGRARNPAGSRRRRDSARRRLQPRRALLLNLVSGASGLVGALVAYAAVDVVPGIRPFMLAFSSASLLYIAMSDLIPDLHRGQIDANAARQVLLIAAGILTIVGFEKLVG